jgi:Skp family chaperone for outer membrane proteins
MNRKQFLFAALAAGFLSLGLNAQVSPAPPQPAASTPAPAASAPAAAQPGGPIAPSAFPAKIALISFEQAVYNTNEGLREAAKVAQKYEPQKAKIIQLGTEIETLKKQAEALPATTPQEERASRLKTIDTKEKQYQRDVEDAQTAYNSDLQEALQKVSQKVYVVLQSYVKVNGYTLVIDAGNQQSAIMWASQEPNADVTEAVINAYNVSSGVAPPAPSTPSAPSAAPRTAPKPGSSSTPRPATPKPPQ